MTSDITQLELDNCTYLSDIEDSGQFECIIQVLFDQHLQVDVETTGGAIFEDTYVRPYGEFVYLNKAHLSGIDTVKGSALVPLNRIASIRFRDDRNYVMSQPR